MQMSSFTAGTTLQEHDVSADTVSSNIFQAAQYTDKV